jgi:drug/metabolite transporter (DMT)-like permease
VKRSSPIIFTFLLIGVTLVWGWTFPVVQDAVDGFGVVAFLAIRFTIASLAMIPLAAKHMTRESWKVGGAIGLVLAISYLFQTWGIRHTTATNSGLITGLFIVFAPLWNRVLFGVKADKVFVGAALASLIGLGLLTGSGPTPLTIGDLLTLGCAIGFGLHIALLGRYSQGHRSSALAIAQLSAAALVFIVVWPFVDPLKLPSSPSVWQALLLTGIVASAVGFWVQTAAQRRIPATRIAMILTMEPVFATFFGYQLAGDRLVGIQIAGGVIMVVALLISNIHQAALASSKPL